jgi:hypothetical protein
LANLRGLISSWWCAVLLTCGRELGSSASGEHQRQPCLCLSLLMVERRPLLSSLSATTPSTGVCRRSSTYRWLCHLGGLIAPIQWAPAASNQVPDIDVVGHVEVLRQGGEG